MKGCTSKTLERIYLEKKFLKFNCLNPKGSELFLGRMKSSETKMEVRTHSDAQIDVMTWEKRRKTHRAAW